MLVLYCVGENQNPRADVVASSVWLMGDASKRHLEVKDLLPGVTTLSVNSVDVSGNTIICGSDSEQLLVVNGLGIC